MRTFHGHVPPVVSRLVPVRQVPTNQMIHLTFSLPLRDEEQLDELIRDLYDPGSANYHHFLSPAEFTSRFGPTVQDYDTLLEFVRTNGFEIIGTHPNRVLVDVVGTARTAERVFGVTLKTYKHPNEARDFYAPDREPAVDAPVTLLDVSGLDNFSLPHPNFKLLPNTSSALEPRAGSGPGGSYRGSDFRKAYVPGTSLTGAGQSVALLQFDGYYSNDIASYISQSGITTSVLLTNIPVNGGVSTPGSGNGEVCLDIEMAIAMAPGLDKIYVYEGPNGGTAWSTILSRIANDNLARQVSCSWGGGGPDTTSEQIFKQMAAQGQSFFNASGDSCAFTGSISFPSESTNITQVGATTLTTGSGAVYSSERAWNWGETIGSSYDGVGTSGGISPTYSIPSWQQGISMTAAQGSMTKRNIPDVALTGDNVYVVYDNGSSGNFGGTSCAAPLWAGFTALINQQAALAAKPPVGFLNPALYAIGTSANYANCFHDTAAGDNFWSSSPTNFPAVAGYDLCTGWGTPRGTNLINALVPLSYAPSIVAGNWSLLAESATPANGVIDSGETVTLSLSLQNQGNLATSNLIATLASNAGVVSPSSPQSYGELAAFGGFTNRTFTFTAAGTCGSNIVAALQLQDGTNNLGAVSFTLPLGKVYGLAEKFDSVTTPNLPANWTSVNVTGVLSSWVSTAASSDTSPNSAFETESSSAGENALVSSPILISSSGAQLSFRHNFGLEYGKYRGTTYYYDGGVLEIQIGNGAFKDILAAGGSFVAGGYNHTITTVSDNPLSGRSAWTASSSGWTTVTVNLPASAAGQSIRLRWNLATDTGNGGGTATGWYVDSVTVSGAAPECLSVFTDLAVSQTLAPNSLTLGQNLVYTLNITNLGPQAAANVAVTDSVPANATFVSASSGGTYSAGKVTFNASMLAAGSATNLTITLAPLVTGSFTNTVAAGTVTPEVTTANNQSTLIATQSAPTPPQITLGPASQTIECGGYASYSIVPSGSVPLSIQWRLDGAPIIGATNSMLTLTNIHLPNHTVTVVVTNLYGSVASNAVLNVQDSLAPVITLTGGTPLTNELGSAFVDPGATASDSCAGPVPVTVTGTVNNSVVGTNTLTYTATDGNGNTNQVTRIVIVRDGKPPTITWSFTNLVLVADSNCVALMPDVTGTNDILGTDLSLPLAITQNPTNGAELPIGDNVVVIAVTDPYGNAAYSTNLIVVEDQTPPQITLNGDSLMTNELGVAFSDPGVVVTDTCSGVELLTNGTVDVNVIGTNVLIYVAVDGSGNSNSVSRTVMVRDTTPPTIAWSFTNLVQALDTNCSALMPDVTGTNSIFATDSSGAVTISQEPTNNTVLSQGIHLVVITVTDSSGNASYSTNEIVVQDQTPPQIKINGASLMTNELGSAFVDPGVEVFDACSGIALLLTNGTVNANAVGTNVLTYLALDGSGNSNSITRTVIVRDTTAPMITWSFTNLVQALDTNCSALMPEVTGTNFILATDLSGALTISQEPTNNAVLSLGTNWVVISVTDGSGNAAYSTNEIVVQDQTPPQFVLQPLSQTNDVGNNAVFSAPAIACTPVQFQWFFNHKILTGATNDLLEITNLESVDTGDYYVVAWSGGGSATSAVATLTIVLTNSFVTSSNSVTLTLSGTPGSTYILEAATNLLPAEWLPFNTNTLGTNGLWQFTDPQAREFQQRFFRLRPVP